MSETPDRARLDELQARIDALKGKEAAPKVEEHYSQAQHAWRMVVELVSGLGIGFVIGYGIDWALGTMPIFLVIFTLLGFVAGVKTMIRTANEIQEGQLHGPKGPTDEEDGKRGD